MTDIAVRAAAAQRLAEDPVLIEVLANIRAAAIGAWEGTRTDDAAAREFAWLTVKVVSRIEAELQGMIDSGTIAAARIQRPTR